MKEIINQNLINLLTKMDYKSIGPNELLSVCSPFLFVKLMSYKYE